MRQNYLSLPIALSETWDDGPFLIFEAPYDNLQYGDQDSWGGLSLENAQRTSACHEPSGIDTGAVHVTTDRNSGS